jgi:hypothetical protein
MDNAYDVLAMSAGGYAEGAGVSKILWIEQFPFWQT